MFYAEQKNRDHGRQSFDSHSLQKLNWSRTTNKSCQFLLIRWPIYLYKTTLSSQKLHLIFHHRQSKKKISSILSCEIFRLVFTYNIGKIFKKLLLFYSTTIMKINTVQKTVESITITFFHDSLFNLQQISLYSTYISHRLTSHIDLLNSIAQPGFKTIILSCQGSSESEASSLSLHLLTTFCILLHLEPTFC